jgi:hypothetical protein
MTEGLRPVQRAFSPKEKLEILPEGVATDNTTEVCRRRGITVNLYYNWRARPLRDIGQVFAHGSSRAGFSQPAALDDRRRGFGHGQSGPRDGQVTPQVRRPFCPGVREAVQPPYPVLMSTRPAWMGTGESKTGICAGAAPAGKAASAMQCLLMLTSMS